MEKHARSVKKDITHVVCLAILAALYLVLFVLSARAFRGVLSNALYYLILSGGSVLGAGLLVTDYVTYFLGKQMIYRFCIIALVFLIFVAAVAYALIVTGFLEVIRDAKNWKSTSNAREVGCRASLFYCSLRKSSFFPYQVRLRWLPGRSCSVRF